MPPLDLEILPPGGGVPDPLLSRPDVDGNGVDLSVGAYNLSATDVVIGQPGSGGLAYSRAYVGGGWRSSFLGTITSAGSKFIVSVDGAAEYFSYSGGVYTNDDGTGATLVSDATTFTYTAPDGTAYVFLKDLKDIVVSSADEAVLTSVTAPNGAVTTMTYVSETDTGSGQVRARLQSVTNSHGFMLHLDYADNDPANAAELNGDWLRVTAVTGINLAQDYCAATAATCTGLTYSWPQSTYTGDTHEIATATDPEDRVTTYGYDANHRLYTVEYPDSGVVNLTIEYDGAGRVTSIDRGFAEWTYAYVDASGNRTTTVTLPGGGTRVIVTDIDSNTVTSVTDPLGRVTEYLYDDKGRTTRVTAEEGNYVEYDYDGRGNVVETLLVDKSGASSVVTSATYPSSPCTNLKTCNKPTSTTDASGEVTNYTYDSNHGGVTSVKAPDPDNGGALVRPESRFFYVQKQARYKSGASTFVNGPQIYVLSATAACATSAFSGAYNASAAHANNNCGAGSGDKTVTEIVWPGTGSANNLLPQSTTARAGDSSVSTSSSFAYDARGWLSATDGPLSGTVDKSVFFYEDTGRQYAAISPDPDGAGGPLKFQAARTIFDSKGLPHRVEAGTVNGQLLSDLGSMTVLQKAETVYDSYGRPVKSIAYANNTSTVLAVSQASYDAAGRVECTAMRMNPAVFGSLPASACSLGTAGTYGQDRIKKKVYDLAGQVTKVISGAGTSLQQDTVTATYTDNGLVATVTDAKGNKTEYAYDGFDRLKKTCFPSKTTPGTVSATDCEINTYDSVGRLTTVRPRKGSIASSAAFDITFTYDDLGRVTRRHVPDSADGTTAAENYDYAYDSFGRVTTATHWGVILAYSYDALGRLTQKTHNGVLGVGYDYDAGGRVSTLTYPDGWELGYNYDYLNRPISMTNSSTTLATVSYDDYGRRATLGYGNGTGVAYDYDGAGRLDELDWDLTGTADDFSYDFAFNPASQLISSTVSDSAREWSVPGLAVDDYTANGLNQYTAIESASPVYDGSGNITTDHRGWTYTYAADNQLKVVKDSGGTPLAAYFYNADGTLRKRAAGAANNSYFYDGDQEIADYATGGSLLRRYVRLPGSVDEVVLMIDMTLDAGCTLTSYAACQVWAHADRLGSTVSTTDASGIEIEAYRYSPYGESGPEGDSGFPFRFTGQKLDAATGLYNYKARFYDPETGRFLQTDPIGYGDGMNMYAYVGGDPVNATDPTGMVESNGPPITCDLHYGCSIPDEVVSIGSRESGFCGITGCDSNWTPDSGIPPEWVIPSTGNVDEIVVTAKREKYDPLGWGWHYYNLASDVGGENCTENEVVDAFLRHGVPGRQPTSPVADGNIYYADDPIITLGDFGLPGGRVLTEVTNGGKTITNTTLRAHVLYDGFIQRNLVSNPVGGYNVFTYGAGNNWLPFGDTVNEFHGKQIFKKVDEQLADYLKGACFGGGW